MVTSGNSFRLVVAFFSLTIAERRVGLLCLHPSRFPAWLGRKIWWRHLYWVSSAAVSLVTYETQPYTNGISEIVTD